MAVLAVGITLAGCASKGEPKGAGTEGRARPLPRATPVLGVTPPCSLAWCLDNGHAGVAGLIVGSNSDTLRFVVPSPLTGVLSTKFPPGPKGERAWLSSLEQGYFLPVRVGSVDGRKGDGRPLAIGSAEESLLIAMIKTSKRRTTPLTYEESHTIPTRDANEWAAWVTSFLEKRRAKQTPPKPPLRTLVVPRASKSSP